MCTLDDILDEGWKFQCSMFISFPQFIYCSHDEEYFPKLSCLIAACDVTAALWCHVVRGCLGDVSNEDLAIIENNQFTNLIE